MFIMPSRSAAHFSAVVAMDELPNAKESARWFVPERLSRYITTGSTISAINISRQFVGHRIPACIMRADHITVAREEPRSVRAAGRKITRSGRARHMVYPHCGCFRRWLPEETETLVFLPYRCPCNRL